MDRRANWSAEVQPNMMVANPRKQLRRIHRRSVFIIPSHRVRRRSGPTIRVWPGEIMHPIRLVKDNRWVKVNLTA